MLSPDFETGGSGACSGSETNLVRALAAGGVTDANGLSQVIYVGTNGEGPLIPTTPRGGHVWVTTNADAGPTSWVDVTQAINPQMFPISSIAPDAADPLARPPMSQSWAFMSRMSGRPQMQDSHGLISPPTCPTLPSIA